MKILAFVDVHNDRKAITRVLKLINEKKPDVVVCAGDISIFEKGLDKIIFDLNSTQVPVLVVHGNHETAARMQDICYFHDNVHFIHKRTHKLHDALFFGYGGGGFSLIDDNFTKSIRSFRKIISQHKKFILVTHAPPHGTSLDMINGEHHGNKSITKFIKESKPKLVICGHFHENAGKKDRIGETTIVNPGPDGVLIEV